MSAAERAIRDALPALEAIAAQIDAGRLFPTEAHPKAEAVRSVAAALQSALGDDSVAPGPTTAQEGSEGLSGQMSGVSGDCGSCQHYRPPEPSDWGAPFGECQRIPETGQLGDDMRDWERDHPVDWNDPSTWLDDIGKWLAGARPQETAFTADASSYRSTLHVRAEFGCVLHTPKETP